MAELVDAMALSNYDSVRIYVEEPMPPKQFVEFEGSHITGDVLLKAIAIAQNPELAKDLL